MVLYLRLRKTITLNQEKEPHLLVALFCKLHLKQRKRKMKRVAFTACLFSLVALLLYPPVKIVATAQAQTSCQQDAYNSCRRIEEKRPDSSRGGATASEYCTLVAIEKCTP